MSIQPNTIFNSGDGIQTALDPSLDYNTGWLQVAPYRNVGVSFLITTALEGTLDTTAITVYGSGSNAAENAGVQIGSFTTTPSATGEVLWLVEVPALPYVRVGYEAGTCSGGAATLLITRC